MAHFLEPQDMRPLQIWPIRLHPGFFGCFEACTHGQEEYAVKRATEERAADTVQERCFWCIFPDFKFYEGPLS